MTFEQPSSAQEAHQCKTIHRMMTTTLFQPLIPSTSSSSPSSASKDPSSPSYSAADSAAADSRVTIARSLSSDLSSTVSQLVVRGARPSDSGAYNCSPSNTKPASLTVHVLDGENCYVSYKLKAR